MTDSSVSSTSTTDYMVGIVGTSKNIVDKREVLKELDLILKQLLETEKSRSIVVVSGGGLIASVAFSLAKKYNLKGVNFC
jgi:hypothetical protein